MSTRAKKRVVVAGATGTIGKALSKRLIERGYELVVFSRNPASAREIVPGAAEYVAWKPEEQGPWEAAVDGAYGVVNLAGAPFFTRWKNVDYKREINDSWSFQAVFGRSRGSSYHVETCCSEEGFGVEVYIPIP